MIVINKGEIEIEGTTNEVLSEFTTLIRDLHDVLSEEISKEFADVAIATAGKLAFTSDDMLKKWKKEMKEEIERMLGK